MTAISSSTSTILHVKYANSPQTNSGHGFYDVNIADCYPVTPSVYLGSHCHQETHTSDIDSAPDEDSDTEHARVTEQPETQHPPPIPEPVPFTPPPTAIIQPPDPPTSAIVERPLPIHAHQEHPETQRRSSRPTTRPLWMTGDQWDLSR